MDNYESNSIVLRTILGYCLSNINTLLLLWYYDILLLEELVDSGLFLLLNLTIGELK